MFEFLSTWGFWLGGALFSSLSAWPAYCLGRAAGKMDAFFDTEMMKDGRWVSAEEWNEAVDTETRKGK